MQAKSPRTRARGWGRGTRLTSRRPLDMAINNKAKMATKTTESRSQKTKKTKKKKKTNERKKWTESEKAKRAKPNAKRGDTNRAKCDMSNTGNSKWRWARYNGNDVGWPGEFIKIIVGDSDKLLEMG